MRKKITAVKIQPKGYKLLVRVALMLCFIGIFQSAKSQDVGVVSLIAPDSSICAATNQTVVLRIKNFDTDSIHYNVDTVIVTVNITGASTQTFNDTLILGDLAPDSTQDVAVTLICDLSVSGAHFFNAYTTLAGDLSASNDTLAMDSIWVKPLPLAVITVYDTTIFCMGDSALLVSNSSSGNVWTGGSTNDSITVTASGDYIVTVTVDGCSSISDTTTITANPFPAVPTITASDTTAFCLGESVILYSSSLTGNTWTGGSTNDSIIVTAAGSYMVTVTIDGCSSVSADTTVIVNPLPTVSLASFSTSPCAQAAPFLLTGGLPAGGTYSGIGVDSTNKFYPGSAGAIQGITYTVTDSNGCSNSATQNMSVHDCTGIEEIASQGIMVYPNPSTNGIFNIAIKNANFNELSISIVDIQGKEIFKALEKNLPSDYNKQINISDIAKGIYYIKLCTDADVKIQKLIIE